MSEKTINIARDFSPYPAGRTHADGPNNGTRFRKELLAPAVQSAIDRQVQKVVVQLDGVRSYGSSFLDEAFAGLIRDENIRNSDLKRVLELQYEDISYKRYRDLIWRFVDLARS
jgi:STAS-like domain of unknown function (DUF4325)